MYKLIIINILLAVLTFLRKYITALWPRFAITFISRRNYYILNKYLVLYTYLDNRNLSVNFYTAFTKIKENLKMNNNSYWIK